MSFKKFHAGAAGVLTAAFVLGAAGLGQAAGPYGYWSTSDAPDGFKLGVIYPSYSPNDFAGMMMICTPGTNVVTITVDSSRPMKDGVRAKVSVIADASRVEYSGTASASEMDDQTRVSFDTTIDDPILDALSRGRKIAFSIGGKANPLPVKGSGDAFRLFRKRCKGQGAESQGE